MKLIYLDLETTGLDPNVHATSQIGAIIEIDGAEREKINIKIRPNPEHSITRGALEVTGVSFDELMSYQFSQYEAYTKLLNILDTYINKYNTNDKFQLITYNGHMFDSAFLRKFFEMHDNSFFGSYFFYPSIDVMLIAAFAAIEQRSKLPNFKLMTVANSLGIEIDESKAHDALYDVEITREMFKLLNKGLNNLS